MLMASCYFFHKYVHIYICIYICMYIFVLPLKNIALTFVKSKPAKSLNKYIKINL